MLAFAITPWSVISLWRYKTANLNLIGERRDALALGIPKKQAMWLIFIDKTINMIFLGDQRVTSSVINTIMQLSFKMGLSNQYTLPVSSLYWRPFSWTMNMATTKRLLKYVFAKHASCKGPCNDDPFIAEKNLLDH